MKILLLLSVFTIFSSAFADKKNVVCYFASWTTYRNGLGKFDVSNIDPTLCTHINFGFIGLNDDASIHILDSWESNDPGGPNGFKNLVGLKQNYPDLKILVSMGGWNEGSKRYSKVASDPVKRRILADNVLIFLQQWGFDGFDLDWEYPGYRGGDEEKDKENFVELLRVLNKVLKPKGYLLTIAGGAGADKIDVAYDIPAINDLVDMVNVMAFDFHGGFEHFVGHVAPMYAAEIDFNFYENATYNVEYAINYWLKKGADPSKINLGAVTYGRTFTLTNETNTSLYAPTRAAGKAGPYSAQSGYLGYNEICEFYADSSIYVWDVEQMVPHRIWDDQWVGFEDKRSLEEKVKFAIEKNLGGMMVWSFDYDDFRGTCGETYPLLKVINKVRQ